ncbi:MAG: complex I subunit 5 family protein [Butyrivibrio sp.]|nr:complex I subunit 5 family protein [Butyrivibrio sp.]
MSVNSLHIFIPDLCGLGLSFNIGGLGLVMAIISTYMWIQTSLFSVEYMKHAAKKPRYFFFLVLTYISTTLVFLSDDVYTTFVFFEIMSIASYVCVIHDEKEKTLRAGGVYLAVAVIGGLVTLMGIFLLKDLVGNLSYETLRDMCEAVLHGGNTSKIRQLYIAAGCILFGFGAKAGMFPLHIWLPMAHPVAPAPASALLSGIITKTGIFGILLLAVRVLPNDSGFGDVLCLLGVITMLLGGLLGIFSMDIKRTLACSSMSQLGMIILGCGMIELLGEENAIAVRGTILHMVNHSNLKLVLFMAAGVIVMNLHKLDLNEIRGYGRKKTALKCVFLSGAIGIGGIPLFNGYVSKTLLHEAVVEYMMHLHDAQRAGLFKAVELLFLLTGGMTVCYMLKLFICVFVESNTDKKLQDEYDKGRKYMSPLTGAVLFVSAFVLPAFGILPFLTLNRIADVSEGSLYGGALEHAVNYFSLENLKGGLISIVIGVLLYVVFVRKLLMIKNSDGDLVYIDRWPKKLDLLTLVYEPVLLVILPAVFGFICRAADFLLDGLILFLRQTTHSQLRERKRIPEGYLRAYYLGTITNKLEDLCRSFLGKGKRKNNYIHILAGKQFVLRESHRVINASSAFSFLMFAVGIIAVVIYLLLA